MRRSLAVPIIMLLLALVTLAALTAPATGAPLLDGPYRVFLPFVAAPPLPTATPTPTETLTPSVTPTPTETLTPTITPTPCEPLVMDWDPRLCRRGVKVTPAAPQPGEGYWRLVKGVWYGPDEPPFAGQHHIFVDALRADGSRQPGVLFDVTNLDATTLFSRMTTELKPGEPYAANFPMYKVAPAYRTIPSDGSPADAVTNLGLGSIEHPEYAYHTSYGFVWQWVVAVTATPADTATPTPTVTPALTGTSVMEGVRP